MENRFRRAALLCAMLLSPAAPRAAVEITLWDFFSGGDGLRWRQLVDAFNRSQGEYHVTGTTLPWGDAFYSRVHQAIAAGEAPEVVTYHLSRFPAGLERGDLRPIPESELRTVGLAYQDFAPALVDLSKGRSAASGEPGAVYGVPLDTHTSLLYYNKGLLKKAGLLGPDGRPLDLAGLDAFTAALKKLGSDTDQLPLALSTANDPVTPFRLWYTLLAQQGGSLSAGDQLRLDQIDTLGKNALQVMADWTRDGLIPARATRRQALAFFTMGNAALLFGGDGEVPTLVDLRRKGVLAFDYGVMAFPRLYARPAAFADSHELCIPASAGRPISAEKLKGVLRFIAYVEKHADVWAGGGHLPAYLPVLSGPALAELAPVNQYAAQAASQVSFVPRSPVFGVGGPVYAAVSDLMVPALTDQVAVPEALARFRQQVEKLSE